MTGHRLGNRLRTAGVAVAGPGPSIARERHGQGAGNAGGRPVRDAGALVGRAENAPLPAPVPVPVAVAVPLPVPVAVRPLGPQVPQARRAPLTPRRGRG